MDSALRQTVFSPLVLWAAWLRIDHWYRSANLPPQPELARWRNHPEAELRTLGADLQEGAWGAVPWLQVPFPKKGACLRHMYLPSVRDQVAFMAHLVLLGPLLDDQLKTFVFGSRWYRPIAWDTRRDPPPVPVPDPPRLPAVRPRPRPLPASGPLVGSPDDRHTHRHGRLRGSRPKA